MKTDDTLFQSIKTALDNNDKNAAIEVYKELYKQPLMVQYYIIKSFKMINCELFFAFTKMIEDHDNKKMYVVLLEDIYDVGNADNYTAAVNGMGNIEEYKITAKKYF